MSDKFKGINYSFSYTQNYNGWTAPQIYDSLVDVENELARLDFLEDEIQEMTEYPEAKALLANIFKY